MLAEGFVFVTDLIPSAREDARYAGSHNFTGRPVRGYRIARVALTLEAAQALRRAAEGFAGQGLFLLMYDGYRPQRAVDDFAAWAADPDDTAGKEEFYPLLDKGELFARGYIAAHSGHTRGSTIDLTLMRADGVPLDMGGEFDWFSPVSAHDYPHLTQAQRENRLLLKEGMIAAGFVPYAQEWWHYTLRDEPYPQTYFDFEIE